MKPKFFNLQEGEEIVWEAKPLKGLKWLMFFGITILWFFVWTFMLLVSIKAVMSISAGSLLIFLLIIFGVPAALAYVVATMIYNKEYYWITNGRVIHKKGMIGYSIHSIPMERVSDVIISRSFIEKIFGIASVHVQSLAGQISYQGTRFGAEGRLRAVKDPEGLQKMIFELVKKNREIKKLGI